MYNSNIQKEVEMIKIIIFKQIFHLFFNNYYILYNHKYDFFYMFSRGNCQFETIYFSTFTTKYRKKLK